MKRLAWLLPVAAFAACGGNGNTSGTWGGGVSSTSSTSSTSSGTGGTTTTSSSGSPCGTCPSGYTCGTANGLPVCRAPSGIPLFSNVFVILMENMTLSSLQSVMSAGDAPNLTSMASSYATGSQYYGVAHPSLPNYIALTSGDTQGITCDCQADPGVSACSLGGLACQAQIGLGFPCSCPVDASNIADQLEAAGKSWMAFGEGMGSPCSVTDSTTSHYAQRHVPFLYYNDIRSDSARCGAHVVDFSSFSPASAAAFNFIAPNLVDDMHDPTSITTGPQTANVENGDKWLGPQIAAITASAAYKDGGLVVVVWDEDDSSGGLTESSDDPIEIFVISPYAKSGGYVSSVKADHYALLATFEDGLGLPRLGNAAGATPLTDYFPAN